MEKYENRICLASRGQDAKPVDDNRLDRRIPSIDLTVALQGAISRRFTAPLALQFAVCDVRASSLCLCLVANAATDVASAFASNVV